MQLNNGKSAIQALSYFTAAACQRPNHSYRTKRIVVVTFPLLWSYASDYYRDGNPEEQALNNNDKFEVASLSESLRKQILERAESVSAEVEALKDAKPVANIKKLTKYSNDGKDWKSAALVGKYFRLSLDNYAVLCSQSKMIKVARPAVRRTTRAGFLEATLAACAACDCRNAMVWWSSFFFFFFFISPFFLLFLYIQNFAHPIGCDLLLPHEARDDSSCQHC
jgi:hypothetical protein